MKLPLIAMLLMDIAGSVSFLIEPQGTGADFSCHATFYRKALHVAC